MAEVSDYLADGRNVVWFDLCSPTVEELAVVGEELGLHELAVEDVHNDHQRPKVDIYDNHLFIAVYAAHFDGENVDLAEVDLFVTANALVTVRQSDRFDIDEVLRRWDAAPHLAGHGVAFLLHGVLDYVVDGHLAVVQELDAQAETLEDALFEERPSSGRELQRRMYDLRKATVRFRKVTMPMREVVGTLRRRDQELAADPRMAPYYEDVYDHALRASEWVESLRDLLANMRETRLARAGLPAERDHETADELGGDHRGADRHHRLLRPERALPRFGRAVGLLVVAGAGGRRLGGAVRGRSRRRTGCEGQGRARAAPVVRGSAPAASRTSPRPRRRIQRQAAPARQQRPAADRGGEQRQLVVRRGHGQAQQPPPVRRCGSARRPARSSRARRRCRETTARMVKRPPSTVNTSAEGAR